MRHKQTVLNLIGDPDHRAHSNHIIEPETFEDHKIDSAAAKANCLGKGPRGGCTLQRASPVQIELMTGSTQATSLQQRSLSENWQKDINPQ